MKKNTKKLKKQPKQSKQKAKKSQKSKEKNVKKRKIEKLLKRNTKNKNNQSPVRKITQKDVIILNEISKLKELTLINEKHYIADDLIRKINSNTNKDYYPIVVAHFEISKELFWTLSSLLHRYVNTTQKIEFFKNYLELPYWNKIEETNHFIGVYDFEDAKKIKLENSGVLFNNDESSVINNIFFDRSTNNFKPYLNNLYINKPYNKREDVFNGTLIIDKDKLKEVLMDFISYMTKKYKINFDNYRKEPNFLIKKSVIASLMDFFNGLGLFSFISEKVFNINHSTGLHHLREVLEIVGSKIDGKDGFFVKEKIMKNVFLLTKAEFTYFLFVNMKDYYFFEEN